MKNDIQNPKDEFRMTKEIRKPNTEVHLAACAKTSCSPREGTRPTIFHRESSCLVGPVPAPGGFFNGLLAARSPVLSFGLRHSFGVRHSSFVLCHPSYASRELRPVNGR